MRFMSFWAIAASEPNSTETAAQIARPGAKRAQASGNRPMQKRSNP